jgi:hypothetical protein
MKDRSEEILRNVIKHKDDILAAADLFLQCLYKSYTGRFNTAKSKNKKKPVDTINANLNADLQRMSMAEISLHYDHENDNRVKEERTGVVKRGNPKHFLSLIN